MDRAAYAAYRELLLPLAESYGVDLPAQPVEDDDHWQAKVDVLVDAAPPVVSFTFGLPEPGAAAALRNAGCTLVQTVTSPKEALQSLEAGMDALIVQSPDAGGHWGTFTPAQPPERLRLPDLVRAVRAAVDLPMMAVGGVGTSADVAAALAAGAQAVAVGTLLLLAHEAGTNPAHRAGFDGRIVATRSRPARSAAAPPGGCPTPSSRRTTDAGRWGTRPCTTSPARSAGPRLPPATPSTSTFGPAPATATSRPARRPRSCRTWRRDGGQVAIIRIMSRS